MRKTATPTLVCFTPAPTEGKGSRHQGTHSHPPHTDSHAHTRTHTPIHVCSKHTERAQEMTDKDTMTHIVQCPSLPRTELLRGRWEHVHTQQGFTGAPHSLLVVHEILHYYWVPYLDFPPGSNPSTGRPKVPFGVQLQTMALFVHCHHCALVCMSVHVHVLPPSCLSVHPGTGIPSPDLPTWTYICRCVLWW